MRRINTTAAFAGRFSDLGITTFKLAGEAAQKTALGCREHSDIGMKTEVREKNLDLHQRLVTNRECDVGKWLIDNTRRSERDRSL
jgi:hypothetical protein